MSLDKNYQCDVIERVDNGGETLLNSNKQFLYIYDELNVERVLMDSYSRSNIDQNVYEFTFRVDDLGFTELGLDTVLLEIMFEGKVIDTIDLTENVISSYNNKLMEQYKLAITLGEIDSSTSVEEFGKNIGFESNPNDTSTYYMCSYSIDYNADYPELKQKASEVQLNLIVMCKDGYRVDFLQGVPIFRDRR